jgi:hypothetical protein
MRLPIPKLAAAAVPALQAVPKFRSELLQSGARWPQDINYLRDTYSDIYQLWLAHETQPGKAYNPEEDKRLYQGTEAKLRELVLGLEDVSKELARRSDVFRMSQNAKHDFATSNSLAKAGDYALATVYQSYALFKVHSLLDGLTREASRKPPAHLAYGYDVSGETGDTGEQDSRSPNLWDQANAPKFDHTSQNPANQMVDAEAENNFPELQSKHRRVNWPARTR